jgi:EAL domain-containing protein (putative c-di-GMP-specific phosphodiesterase class I)
MNNMTEHKNQQKPGHDAKAAIAYIHDGMHVFANESYIKLFKFSDLDEILATPFMDMVAEECRKELKLSLRNSQQSGKTTDKEQPIARMAIVALDANQAAFPVDLCLKPTFYEGEHCLQVLIISKQAQGTVAARMVVKHSRREQLARTMIGELPTQEAISSALENDSLTLVYQPVLSTLVMQPEFYDIYPQMRGPHKQIWTAEQITSVVANTALAQQLDRWISERAIRLLGYLCSQGRTLQFQLTITAQTVRDASFSAWLASQLTECGVEANCLVLNLREVDVLACIDEAITLIKTLHEGGGRVCISGYSNGEAIAAVVSECKVCLVRFDNDISDLDSRNMLSLGALKNLVDSLHKDAVKVIAAEVHDKETVDCLWLAEVDLVQGGWFQPQAQELHAKSFRTAVPVLRNAI